jgi:hypothetical protein
MKPLTAFRHRYRDGKVVAIYRACRDCEHHARRLRRSGVTATDPRYPAGPFVEWLRARAARDGYKPLARELGLHEARLRNMVGDPPDSFRLSTIDRILTALDEVDALNLLYPLSLEMVA